MENITYEQTSLLQNLLAILSEEVASSFENFSEHKKHYILHLPTHQQRAWSKLHYDILRLKKRKADLEDALVSGNVKTEELVTANATLEGMNKSITTLEAQEDAMITPQRTSTVDQPNPLYDRNARPGVLSIRPTYKGTQPPPVNRQIKD